MSRQENQPNLEKIARQLALARAVAVHTLRQILTAAQENKLAAAEMGGGLLLMAAAFPTALLNSEISTLIFVSGLGSFIVGGLTYASSEAAKINTEYKQEHPPQDHQLADILAPEHVSTITLEGKHPNKLKLCLKRLLLKKNNR